jgi:uncharacterized protein YjbI with pentapeptide repeats
MTVPGPQTVAASAPRPALEIINDTGLPLNWITGVVTFPQRSAAFIIKAAFELASGGVARKAAAQLDHTGDLPWPPLPGREGEASLRYPSDFALFKPHADILLVGSAHAPGGVPVPALTVQLGVGPWRKGVAVIGDRRWQGMRQSDPLPFTTMPLRWELAFGGAGFEENPLGSGRAGDRLPNLERVGSLVTTPRSKPIPACFAPVAMEWEERRRKAGTYRGDYLATRWPGFPADFDWSWFNSAPLDQQVKGYLDGDETLLLEHMHPQHARVECRLPSTRPRLFVARRNGACEEVALVCDTLWIDAEALVAVQVWRGLCPVADEVLSDLAAIHLIEEPSALRAPSEQHLAEFARRRAAAQQPREQRGDAADLAAMAEQLGHPLARPVSGEWTSESVRRHLAGGGSLADQDLRGLDLSGLAAPGAALRGALLAHARLSGCRLPGADLAQADLNGAECNGADLRGADLSGADLTGARLEQVDLREAKLTGALLVAATLRGAQLADASADAADFSRADLTGADLSRAVLDAALFNGARLDGARVQAASLKEATLAGASAVKADFEGADLSKVKAGPDAELSGANLRRIQGGGGSWARCQLTGADFTFARLDGAQFPEASLANAMFLGASLKRALFDGADLTDAAFDQANLCGGSLARTTLLRTSFRSANCYQAGFLSALRRGADFSGANVIGSDLVAGAEKA